MTRGARSQCVSLGLLCAWMGLFHSAVELVLPALLLSDTCRASSAAMMSSAVINISFLESLLTLPTVLA